MTERKYITREEIERLGFQIGDRIEVERVQAPEDDLPSPKIGYYLDIGPDPNGGEMIGLADGKRNGRIETLLEGVNLVNINLLNIRQINKLGITTNSQ